MGIGRRVGILAAVAAVQLGLAYRFALAYRVRAGYPRRDPPRVSPADLGLPFEVLSIPSAGLDLPGWFIPARDGEPGPGVVLVHGWESARDRTLPMAVFLHAAGFHCLTFDVRGHGANPPETLPLSAGEFGLDAATAFDVMMARPEVTVGAISGHSMGATGAILAGAADQRVAAIVATSGPSGPYRLTRQTFHLAHLPIPDPIAYPLAWLTTRVYLRPRGHRARATSASAALGRYRGPILLVHGDQDAIMPASHLGRLERAALTARRGDPSAGVVESLRIPGGQHSWLYENPVYRRAVARFLTLACGGPLDPELAGEIAAATRSERIPDADIGFGAVAGSPSGIRTLAGVALPGATRPPAVPRPTAPAIQGAMDVPPDVTRPA
jgi:pimeloyl-ACP methyl ester carboxylesterase